MKKSLDNRLHEEMNREQELPEIVQKVFDRSYEEIRSKTTKKIKKRWLKPISAAAACAVLASGVILSNDTAMAKLKAFLGFQEDAGIELASQNGEVQYVGVSQSSQDVTVTLENTFADAYRVGLQMEILPKDIDINNIQDARIEFRIYDSTGKEIDALVSDTKPLKSPGIMGGAEMKMLKESNQSIILELLLQSNKLAWPSLNNAQLVIETVHFYTEKEGIVTINGEWPFTLTPTKVVTQSFEAEKAVEGIQLQSATLTNGSMHVSLMVDADLHEDENQFFEWALTNEKGEAFYARGANIELKDGKTFVNLVYPYSIWNKEKQISLNIKGYEELILISKE
ncbi:DUF4179 domain-containing protein [Lysinibacillus sp. NPDC056185]|uniref:DUF4179 domain-containing protein n=1 Tax=Lysinibacillus sp. NPDC056185 TaxID=3345739 RepID=UPI0039F055B7